MQINIDVNLIIENLTQEVSKYVHENAILKAQIQAMTEMLQEKESETNESESNE